MTFPFLLRRGRPPSDAGGIFGDPLAPPDNDFTVYHPCLLGILLVVACETGNVGALHQLLALTDAWFVDVRGDNCAAFCGACLYGNIDIVNAMLVLDGERRVDVNALDDYAFKQACAWGRVEVVRILLALDGDWRVDVHAGNSAAFRWACDHENLGVVRELLVLDGHRAVPREVQNAHAQMCARAVEEWTATQATWAWCPVRRRLHALSPAVLSAASPHIKAAQWGSRRGVLLSRKEARATMRFT